MSHWFLALYFWQTFPINHHSYCSIRTTGVDEKTFKRARILPAITIPLLPSGSPSIIKTDLVTLLPGGVSMPKIFATETSLKFHSTRAGNLVVRTTWHLNSQERGSCSELLGHGGPLYPAL